MVANPLDCPEVTELEIALVRTHLTLSRDKMGRIKLDGWLK